MKKLDEELYKVLYGKLSCFYISHTYTSGEFILEAYHIIITRINKKIYASANERNK